MIKVICEVNTHDGSPVPNIKVYSHWNNDRLVVLEIGDKMVAVLADELKAAIDNCTNVKRW